MLVVTMLTLVGQLYEVQLESNEDCFLTENGIKCPQLPTYLVFVDLIFVVFTMFELILKVSMFNALATLVCVGDRLK